MKIFFLSSVLASIFGISIVLFAAAKPPVVLECTRLPFKDIKELEVIRGVDGYALLIKNEKGSLRYLSVEKGFNVYSISLHPAGVWGFTRLERGSDLRWYVTTNEPGHEIIYPVDCVQNFKQGQN